MPDDDDKELVFPYGVFALGRSLTILSFFSKRLIAKELQGVNLNKDQAGILILLYYYQEIKTCKEINRFFGYTETTFKNLINSLVEEGYLSLGNNTDIGDCDVILTEKGCAVKKNILKALEKEERLFSEIVGEDEAALRMELFNLAESLKDYDFNKNEE